MTVNPIRMGLTLAAVLFLALIGVLLGIVLEAGRTFRRLVLPLLLVASSFTAAAAQSGSVHILIVNLSGHEVDVFASPDAETPIARIPPFVDKPGARAPCLVLRDRSGTGVLIAHMVGTERGVYSQPFDFAWTGGWLWVVGDHGRPGMLQPVPERCTGAVA